MSFKREKLAAMDLDTLVKMVDATPHNHFSVFRFSNHWKAAFGTPDLGVPTIEELGGGIQSGYDQVWALPSYESLKEALVEMLMRQQEFPERLLQREIDERQMRAAERLWGDDSTKM